MKTTSASLRTLLTIRTLLTAALLAAPSLGQAAAAPVPAPAGETKGAQSPILKPHILAPTEEINVGVEGEPDTLRMVTIDEKGEVDLYLIRRIKVGGLTVEQAARAIEKAYQDGRFIRRPKVGITIQRQVIQTVSVYGQVRKPGNIIIPSDRVVDIVDVISYAEGFNDVAKESSVKVTRVLEDGSPKTYDDIDVGAMIKGRKDRKDALVILPGDIITVPMRIF